MFPLFFFFGGGVGSAVTDPVAADFAFAFAFALPFATAAAAAADVFFEMPCGCFAAADVFVFAFAFGEVACALAFGEVALFTTFLALPLTLADGLPPPAPVVPLGEVVGALPRAADMMQESGFITARNLSMCAQI